MNVPHYLTKCRACGKIIAQCSCPVTDKVVTYQTCAPCLKILQHKET